MKEFASETGGRYTYVDDILNLQELSLSMTSIFTGCSDFIISGCEVSGANISSGYVWINGKIRRFAGITGVTFPYYIYESNGTEMVTYANEINKKGRNNYLCLGTAGVPETVDPVTGLVPQFIKVDSDYAPRFIDKFFGKYSVLLNSPFAKQTIGKDISFAGAVDIAGGVDSRTSISVSNVTTGAVLKNIIKPTGNASIGAYISGQLISEIVLNTDGTISFYKADIEILKISESGMALSRLDLTTLHAGTFKISGNSINNYTDTTDTGSINFNTFGLNGGTTKYRNFNVFDGKQSANPLFQIVGSTAIVNINAGFFITNSGTGFTIKNKAKVKTDKTLTNSIKWTDSAGELIAQAGFVDIESFDFAISNVIGNITITPLSYIDVKGAIKINGTNISDTYATQSQLTEALKTKVSVVDGKQLSSEDFTSTFKQAIEKVKFGNFDYKDVSNVSHALVDGIVTSSQIVSELGKYATKLFSGYSSEEKQTATANLGVYTKDACNTTFAKVSEGLQGYVNSIVLAGAGLIDAPAAQQTLRTQIDAASKTDLSKCLKTGSKLADLEISGIEDQKAICTKLGAAYAPDYQKSLFDSGWKKIVGTGKMTNNALYARQIGNIVSIQGTLNTNNFEVISGANILCELPNEIQSPTHAVGWSKSEIGSHETNRGVYITIDASGRKLQFKEIYGADSWNLNFSLTYMV